jgi:hypothetical protein
LGDLKPLRYVVQAIAMRRPPTDQGLVSGLADQTNQFGFVAR